MPASELRFPGVAWQVQLSSFYGWRDAVSLDALLRQVGNSNDRHHRQRELQRSCEPAMTRDDHVATVDDDGIC